MGNSINKTLVIYYSVIWDLHVLQNRCIELADSVIYKQQIGLLIITCWNAPIGYYGYNEKAQLKLILKKVMKMTSSCKW